MRVHTGGAALTERRGIPVGDRKAEGAACPPDQQPPAAYRLIARLVVWTILLVAVGAVGAYAVAARGEVVHAARSEVAFDLRAFGWDASERFLRTQPLIARSRVVLSPIAAQFDMPVVVMEESLSAETVGGSGVIRLQFEHPSEAVAVDVLRALTARYLAEVSVFDQAAPIIRWVITDPFVLADPIAPQPLRAAALGAAGGVLLAAGMVLLLKPAWPAPQRPRRRRDPAENDGRAARPR